MQHNKHKNIDNSCRSGGAGRRILGILFAVVVLLCLYSLAPVIMFIFKPALEGYTQNIETTEKFKNKSGDNFAFLVISDTATGILPTESAALKLISRMNREDRFRNDKDNTEKIPIDFAVNVGDVTYRGTDDHFRSYMKMESMIKYPVLNVKGNHDDDGDREGQEPLFGKYCGEKEFSFTDRNSYFIVLDDSDSDFTAEQFEWFEKELKKSAHYDNRFVFMHKPPFNPYQQSWYRIETCPWSYPFMKMCERYKVTAVFSGHEYVQRTVKFGGVTYVVSGGGGSLLHEAPSWDNSVLHYIFVKVNGDYVDYEIRKVFPPLWEYFTFYLWKDLIFFVKDLLN